MKAIWIKIKLLILFIRVICLFLGLDCWNEWIVSGFPDLAEVIQYKMVGGSGSSSSNPRWNLDLNLHPREEVEVPVEEATEPDINLLLRLREQEKIQAQKGELAELITPLINKNAGDFPSMKERELPSPTEFVELLICSMGTEKAILGNKGPNATPEDIKCLKAWLTRACKSAKADGAGNMSIENGIHTLLRKMSEDH